MENLTKDLQKLIDKKVQEKINEITGNIQEYVDWIEGLDETMESLINDARKYIEDFDEENLTINKIESEGFLRGLITVKNQIDHGKRWINNHLGGSCYTNKE